MKLTDQNIEGRAIAAARVLLGLEQSEIAARAKVSNSTVSNAENATVEARESTISAIRKALRRLGATVHIDRTNGRVLLAMDFEVEDDS